MRPTSPSPAAVPTAAAPQAPAVRGGGDSEGGGFGAAVRSLVGRKYRELKGRRWERATERQRIAEATRRGREEMARRVKRETGRRMSASTVQRYAARDAAPTGVDQLRADRQAAIDRAGGVGRLASQLGVTARQVSRWRDSGGDLEPAPRPLTITVAVDGILWAHGKPYPRTMTVTITLTAEQARPVRQARSIGDDSALRALLDVHITEQVDWSGELDRTFHTDVIESISYQE